MCKIINNREWEMPIVSAFPSKIEDKSKYRSPKQARIRCMIQNKFIRYQLSQQHVCSFLYMPADVTKSEHSSSYRRHNCYVCRLPYIAKTILLPNLKPMWWCILLSVMWFKEILKTRNEFWELLHITIHREQHNPDKWHDVYGLTCFVSSSLISHMMYTFFMVLADGSGKSLKYSTIEVIIHQTTWCGG